MPTDAKREVYAAATNLVDVWRDPDPDAWRHVDDSLVVEAIERLCAAVEDARGRS